MINPFDGGGFGLADMTDSINIIPNVYTKLGQMGLFRFEGVTQRSVIVEQANGVLSLLPPVPLGGPATVADRDERNMRSFVLPWIPHDDVILPADLQGIRKLGSGFDSVDLATLMMRKVSRMRTKHAQTLEYMEANALRGIVKAGDGRTLYNYYSEYGLQQFEVDFALGTASTDVAEKCRTILRHIEENLQGESMNGCLVLVSPMFWDKLIKHQSVREAYKYYASGNMQPLRNDVRRGFPFNGVIFEEYNATVTLSTGVKERLIPDNECVAFPLGTSDTFVTYGGPGNFLDAVNTIGLPMYARQLTRPDDSGIDVKTEASPLPMNRRPSLSVKVLSSN
jgi:hypothetical protein